MEKLLPKYAIVNIFVFPAAAVLNGSIDAARDSEHKYFVVIGKTAVVRFSGMNVYFNISVAYMETRSCLNKIHSIKRVKEMLCWNRNQNSHEILRVNKLSYLSTKFYLTTQNLAF